MALLPPSAGFGARVRHRAPEQPRRVAAEYEFRTGAEAQRGDLADRIVAAHVEGAVRAEQDLPGTGVADQVREEIVVVGDGVVVEPAQRLVRAGADPGPRLGADRGRPAEPPADHWQGTAAVRQQHP